MGICLQQILPYDRVVKFIREVSKRLVDDESDTMLPCPINEPEKIFKRNVVAAWIVRVDHDQILDLLISEEIHKVICRICIVPVIWYEVNGLFSVVSVGILVKCGSYESRSSVQKTHEGLDQFRRAVSYHYVFLMYGEVFCGEKRIDPHAAGILCEQSIKAGPELVLHLLVREIRIHKIAEVQKLGISPVSAIPALKKLYPLILVR